MSPARRSFNLAPTPATDRAEDWRDSALCIGVDPEWFFVDGSQWAKHPAEEARAKAICADCPVIAECLENAYATNDGHSIRGGLTPHERDKARRNAKRASRIKPPDPGRCRNNHDLTAPGARYANRNCRQCALDRQARVRSKQKEAKAS